MLNMGTVWANLREALAALAKKNARKPQSTVRVTKNDGSDNHPATLWGIAQMLAVMIAKGYMQENSDPT